ncbi:MAG: hypothetical protein KF720_12830 [Rubrivivax sp.]|nr:hypothetical protein [Rubrivivax sp.]
MKLVQSLALICACAAMAGAAVAQNKPTRLAAKAPTPVQGAQSVLPTLSPADQEQLLAASQAYYGPYDCEFKQTLSVTRHPIDGYVVVTFSSKAYTMKPVRSSTGALRLEEVGNGPMLMVQIPAKSMLMDTARGRRIVDACVNEMQAKQAAPEANALGMNLPGQVDTSGIAVTQSPTVKR